MRARFVSSSLTLCVVPLASVALLICSFWRLAGGYRAALFTLVNGRGGCGTDVRCEDLAVGPHVRLAQT